jgi:hypothetical protein
MIIIMKTSPFPILVRPNLALLLLAVIFTATAARSQTSFNPPQLMSYQGYLTDQSGSPLGATNTGPKNYNLIFRIWNTQTGGTVGGASELYAEQQTVTVTSGYFSCLLGLGSVVTGEPHTSQLSSLFRATQNTPVYVEITALGIGPAGGNITILPRLQLVSSPYAFLAANAVNAANLVNANNATVINVNNTNVGINMTPTAAALAVNGNITASSATINGALTTTGLATLNSATVTGALNAGSATVSGDFSAGAATLTSATINGALTVNNVSSVFNAGLQVNNGITVNSNIANMNAGAQAGVCL